MKFTAYGMPAPQGSKSFKGLRDGHAILAESSKKVKPWRQRVKTAAAFCKGEGAPLDGALICRMIFTMPKPKSAPKRRKVYPIGRPDLSKLVRSTEDAMTDAGLIADDARIVEYSRVAKVYPGEDDEALNMPGVVVTVQRLADVG